MDFDKVEELIKCGYIAKRKHPSLPLWIYNYTSKCQYEKHWVDECRGCRGLIADEENNTIGACLNKFFGYSELAQLPEEDSKLLACVASGEPMEVQQKLDGSYISVCSYHGEVIVASRGSFTSSQAHKARYILQDRYRDFRPLAGVTYVFEILYPENRIVVNYGELEDLVLLTTIHTSTGVELDTGAEFPFPKPTKYVCNNIGAALSLEQNENEEGVVVYFPESGFRVKVKWSEYTRLHRLITGITPRQIWKDLSEGASVKRMIGVVPQEWYEWAQGVEYNLQKGFDDIYFQAQADFFAAKRERFTERKQWAEYFSVRPYPSIMFMLLDEKDPSGIIWKMLRPEASKPFKCGEDDG